MSFTQITPFTEQLPNSDDPASFDMRTTALMSWLVSNLGPEVTTLATEIAAALNGEENTLAALQAILDGLGSVAARDVSAAVGNNAKIPDGAGIVAYINAFFLAHAIGFGQTNEDMTASRTDGVSYQNTTGKPIMVFIGATGPGGFSFLQSSADNSTWINSGRVHPNSGQSTSMLVPDQHYYQITSGASVVFWTEFR